MKTFFLFLLCYFFFTWSLQAQSVGVGTAIPDPSAALDVSSSTKGMLIPRMTAAQRAAIASPTIGLQVYQTDGTKGIYHYDGTNWLPVGNSTGAWSTTGNANINPATNFIGTTDAQPLIGKVNNEQVFRFTPNSNSTTIGYMAHKSDYAGGTYNHVVGYKAGYNNAGSFSHFDGLNTGYNNYGNNNQFIGYNTGYSNTSGGSNLFIGSAAGYSNTSGSQNHFIGYQAGYANTTVTGNQFEGFQSGFKNTTGTQNQFAGFQSGYNNTNGHYNFFDGYKAGFSNVVGQNNYFSGYEAGYSNVTDNNHFAGFKAGYSTTTGHYNTFSGLLAGFSNTTGEKNHFEGYTAGYSNTTGSRNYFSGFGAGRNTTTGGYNQFTGFESGLNNTTGTHNLFLGYQSGYNTTTGTLNTYLGFQAGYHNTSGIGNVYIGTGAGYDSLGNYQLIIESSGSVKPLVVGNFATNKFNINGSSLIKKASNTSAPVLELMESNQVFTKLRFSRSTNFIYWWDQCAYIDQAYWEDAQMLWKFADQHKMLLYGTGDLTIWGDLFEYSDSTLKENIQVLPNVLDRLHSIRSVSYNWKNRNERVKRNEIGFLAQEVEREFPELVQTNDLGEKSVSYTHMVPVLLQAIKEQQTEIDSLNERMAKMEEMMAAMIKN